MKLLFAIHSCQVDSRRGQRCGVEGAEATVAWLEVTKQTTNSHYMYSMNAENHTLGKDFYLRSCYCFILAFPQLLNPQIHKGPAEGIHSA